MLDAARFAREKSLDRARELRVRQPVRGPGLTGIRPRAILCSPWAPPSKRAMPRAMHHSIGW